MGKIGNMISLIRHLVGVLALDGVTRDAARLRRYQEARLRALVRHAYARVPLYRRRFDAVGLRPESIRTLDDFSRIPILSKRELREASREDIIASGMRPEDCFLVETSGSTGEPIRLYKDNDALFALGRVGLAAKHLPLGAPAGLADDDAARAVLPLAAAVGLSGELVVSVDNAALPVVRFRTQERVRVAQVEATRGVRVERVAPIAAVGVDGALPFRGQTRPRGV